MIWIFAVKDMKVLLLRWIHRRDQDLAIYSCLIAGIMLALLQLVNLVREGERWLQALNWDSSMIGHLLTFMKDLKPWIRVYPTFLSDFNFGKIDLRQISLYISFAGRKEYEVYYDNWINETIPYAGNAINGK